jgi:endonuclease/exonuclease/phosphatase (EEP) superfamily protein YafD
MIAFLKRMTIAATVLLAPPHAAIVVLYFVARLTGHVDHWLVDALSYVLPLLLLLSILHFPGAIWRRSPYLLSASAIPLVAFGVLYGPSFVPKPQAQDVEASFSVMSYNVWGGNDRFDSIVSAIKEYSPDVVGLQEITDRIADEIKGPLTDLYPYQVIEDGQAIFSRFPIVSHDVWLIGDDQIPISVQHVELDVAGQRIGVINAHPHSPALRASRIPGFKLGYPSGLWSQHRDWEVRELMEVIATIDGPLVVLGDFNLTNLQVVYGEMTQTLRDAHADVGYGLGFTRTPLRGTGPATWRIDYVFHTPELIALSITNGDFGGSDHRPVVAELAFRSSEPKGAP